MSDPNDPQPADPLAHRELMDPSYEGDWISRRVGANGTTLGLDEWESPGAGAPVALFLHGNGMSRGVWRRIVPALTDRCHAVAADFRGHGDSDKPAGDYLWTGLADDVIALVEQETAEQKGWAPLLLVGHSLGGAVSIDIAVRRPDLVRALVLLEPVMGNRSMPPTSEGITQRVEGTLRRRAGWPTRDEAASYLRERAAYASWDAEVFAGFIATGVADTPDGVALACPPEVEAEIYRAGNVHTPFLQLSEVRCPVWLAHSEDPGPARIDGAMDRIARGVERVSSGTGHFLPHERPDWAAAVVAEALDALASNEA